MPGAPLLVEEQHELPVGRGAELLELAPVGGEGPGRLVALGIERPEFQAAGDIGEGQAPAVAGEAE